MEEIVPLLHHLANNPLGSIEMTNILGTLYQLRDQFHRETPLITPTGIVILRSPDIKRFHRNIIHRRPISDQHR